MRPGRRFLPPVALTIAGSDSSGGAGLQADLHTFAALGVYAATAVTAVTAQNTTGVRRVDALPPEAVTSQVEAVLDDLPVAAVKTGMLAEAGIVAAVAGLASAGRLPHLVVDPVLVASSGAVLASEEAVAAYRELLLPVAEVITPNLPEAAVLAGLDDEERRQVGDRTRRDHEELARVLGRRYATTVVVTGGHGGGDRAVDVVWHEGGLHHFSRPRLDTPNTHGSGCTFAAALTASLARGEGVLQAIERAGDVVAAAIAAGASWGLGAGPGPLDHFGWAVSS